MKDFLQTELSQFANSPTIGQLIENMNNYIRPDIDIDNFYNYVWNIATAQGFGLDIWGRIVNIKRTLTIPVPDYFGFAEGDGSFFPFGQESFYNGTPATQTYTLSDDAYRQLILVKALANISSTNAPSINALLQSMFSTRGRCYVNDLGGMEMRYTFEFLLTPYEFAIITQSGVFPTPAGVLVSMLSVQLPAFGFREAGTDTAAPFGQAPFIQPGATNAIN